MEHDEECERVENFYLCHCAKRERLSRGVTELPQLWIQYPICGGCDKETWHDGNSLRCDNCHVTWAENAQDGDPAESFWDNYDDTAGTLADMRAKWLNRTNTGVPADVI